MRRSQHTSDRHWKGEFLNGSLASLMHYSHRIRASAKAITTHKSRIKRLYPVYFLFLFFFERGNFQDSGRIPITLLLMGIPMQTADSNKS